MTTERWVRIKGIFNAALERAEAERTDFIAMACGSDEELCRELERLLREHSLAPPLESPVKLPDLAGRTISHYRIIEKLGQGGMGDVYRAEDMNLARHVAIKVLPDVFASDPERLARFDREAKILAALSHPNIASIYGLEQADDKRFLVLELVEGQTLARRLFDGPLPVDLALDVCRQIAEGLEAAHEKGVIHRDLKPANVQITSEGKVKLLDFGIARALQGQPAEVSQPHSLAISETMTRPGVVLGTAAYISPEQAKGQRADIWAFGCVMYECLTGKRAFQGETIPETIASILKSEPDWEALPPSTSVKVRDLLRQCLAKDPRERLRDVGDVRLLISDSLTGPPHKVAKAESTAPHSRRRLVLRLAVAAFAGLLAGMLVVEWPNRSRKNSTVIHSSWPFRAELLLDLDVDVLEWHPSLAISPDGRRVAFVGVDKGVWRIYQRTADMREAVPLVSGKVLCAGS